MINLVNLVIMNNSNYRSYQRYDMQTRRERARWTKSRAVIGYPSGQDGAILPARDYPLYPASKISPKAI